MDFVETIAEYEKDLPDEQTLVKDAAKLVDALIAAKKSGQGLHEAKYALRHARWYWRTIREVYPAEVGPGDAVAGAGHVRNGGQ